MVPGHGAVDPSTSGGDEAPSATPIYVPGAFGWGSGILVVNGVAGVRGFRTRTAET